jgi:septum formation protein
MTNRSTDQPTNDQAPQLILASGSPRRQQFLRELGLAYQVVVADMDETPYADEAPIALAHRLAEAKAEAVAARLPEEEAALIIAADTVVALGNQLLGKPLDDADAAQMLQTLRNRPHHVHSSVCVLDRRSGARRTRVNSTAVQMRDYSDAELAAYIATGDPRDKAGAYAIQHPEFAPACAVDGCISGVIGLPLSDMGELLAAFGVVLPTSVAEVCERQTAFPCCQRPGTTT